MSIQTFATAATLPTAQDFSQSEMYAYWIEDRCIGKLGYSKALTDDAFNSASAWLQFGNLPIEAYEEGTELIDSRLKIKLDGSAPGKFKVLQCALIAHSIDVRNLFMKYQDIRRKQLEKAGR